MAGLYDEEILGAKQQAETYRKLREGVKQPDGQMVSGWYVAPSITQRLAEVLKGYQGAQGEKAAEAKIADLLAKKRKATDEWMTTMPQNTPERQAPTFDSGTNQLVADALRGGSPSAEMPLPQQTGSQTIPAQQATPEQRLAWIMKGQSIDPAAAGLGAKYMEMEQGREATAQEREAARAFQEQENQRNRENQRIGWQISAGNKPDKIITVMDENGTPFSIPQSQFQQGMTIYNPSTAASMKAAKEKAGAQKSLSTDIGQMMDYYEKLKSGGGIPSTENGWLANVGAKLSQSTIGDAAGSTFGTDNATNRQSLEMMRPTVMQGLKKALDMTGGQMNSDADIKLAMQMVSNPNAYSFEANMRQLALLDRKLGLGLNMGRVLEPNASAGKVTQGTAPQGAHPEDIMSLVGQYGSKQ